MKEEMTITIKLTSHVSLELWEAIGLSIVKHNEQVRTKPEYYDMSHIVPGTSGQIIKVESKENEIIVSI